MYQILRIIIYNTSTGKTIKDITPEGKEFIAELKSKVGVEKYVWGRVLNERTKLKDKDVKIDANFFTKNTSKK